MKRVFLILVLVTNPVYASLVQSSVTEINDVFTYTTFGNGDVVFQVLNSPANCEGGFWFNKDDFGYDSSLSFMLSAFHGNRKVRIYAHSNERWSGSSDNYCHLDVIRLVK